MATVHVSIGNSDGKLSHIEWADFYGLVDELLGNNAEVVYGCWHSLPATPYVNACWAVEIRNDLQRPVKELLGQLAGKFRQATVAWLAGETEFIEGTVPTCSPA